MRDIKKFLAVVSCAFAVLVLLGSVLAACSSGATAGDDDDSGEASTFNSQPAEVSGGEERSSDEDAYLDGAESEPDSAASGGGIDSATYITSQVPFDRLIIRTVTITLTVDNVNDGSVWIRELATRKSGFVFSSNTYVRDDSEFAQLTIRVPANDLDGTMRELREHDLVVRVDSEETTSQDVSQEYVDNESRLVALEETQRRFLALLSEADSVEDILRIEAELTNIRSQIETIIGRQNYLDQMTSMSTITVTLRANGVEFAGTTDGDSFIARVFGDSWTSASGVIEGVMRATVTLVIIGAVVVPLGVAIFVIARVLYRRIRLILQSPAGRADQGAKAGIN